MGPLTVVIGARIAAADAARQRNLAACLTALGRQGLPRDRYRVVLVEQDGAPRLPLATTPLVDEYLFAYNASAYNRAWGLNLGAATARDGVLCLMDADLLLPPDFLERGLTAWRSGALAVRPFQEVLYLDEASTRLACEDVTSERVIDPADARYSGELFHQSQGGCLWVDVGVYQRAGGHDERFEGWGREDREFWNRLSTVTSIVTLPGRLLHLCHSRSAETEPGAEANRRLYRKLEMGVLQRRSTPAVDLGRYRTGMVHDAANGRPPSRAPAEPRGDRAAMRQRAEPLLRAVQHAFDGPLRQLECRDLGFDAWGLECALLRAFSTQLGIDVAIKVPWRRFDSNDNDGCVDNRAVLAQEACLLEHASRLGLPAPTVLTLFCGGCHDLLITTYIENDGTGADDREMGALLARLHAGGAPECALVHQDRGTFAATIAARVTSRCAAIGRLTGAEVCMPPVLRVEEMIVEHASDTSLLHMDFRRANLLVSGGRVRGIVDWSNALYGDRALELARIAESGNLTPRFEEGYGFPGTLEQRDACLQALYRLDAAAMLAIVFLSESPDPARARQFVARVRQLAAAVRAA